MRGPDTLFGSYTRYLTSRQSNVGLLFDTGRNCTFAAWVGPTDMTHPADISKDRQVKFGKLSDHTSGHNKLHDCLSAVCSQLNCWFWQYYRSNTSGPYNMPKAARLVVLTNKLPVNLWSYHLRAEPHRMVRYQSIEGSHCYCASGRREWSLCTVRPITQQRTQERSGKPRPLCHRFDSRWNMIFSPCYR